MFGSHGEILRVDLSSSKISREEIPQDLFDKYLAGAGMATHYLYHEVPEGVDPLGPQNELIAMTGALTGTVAPSTGGMITPRNCPNTWLSGSTDTLMGARSGLMRSSTRFSPRTSSSASTRDSPGP